MRYVNSILNQRKKVRIERNFDSQPPFSIQTATIFTFLEFTNNFRKLFTYNLVERRII